MDRKFTILNPEHNIVASENMISVTKEKTIPFRAFTTGMSTQERQKILTCLLRGQKIAEAAFNFDLAWSFAVAADIIKHIIPDKDLTESDAKKQNAKIKRMPVPTELAAMMPGEFDHLMLEIPE